MSVTYSQTAIDARLQAVVTVIGSSGVLRLNDGASLLLALTLATPCGTVSGGVLTFTTPLRGDTSGTGTADNVSITDSAGNAVISNLSVGIPLSGAEVIMSNGLNNTDISIGQVVTLLSAQIVGS